MSSLPLLSMIANLPCEYINLTLTDEYIARARLFGSDSAKRAVLYLHGIQSHSGWFVRSCDYLGNQGMTVLAMDRRGSGMNQQDRGHCDNMGQLLDDIDTAVEWLKEHSRLPQIDIVAVSWSAKLGLAYAERYEEKIRSLALVGPGLCPRIDISLKEKFSVGLSGLVNPHKLYPIPLTEPTLFTDNPPMLEFLACDPLMLKEATASFFIASKKLDFQARQAVGKIKLPVSLFLAERDRIVDNKATIDFLKRALTPHENLPQGCKIYRKAHHTLDFEPEPQLFFSDLAQVLLE